MTVYKILKKHDLKRIKELLLDVYGFTVPNDWRFYNTSDERIWLLTPELEDYDFSNYNIEAMGLYFCFFDSERFRLSPEAAQLVGESAGKNVLLISDEQAEQLIRGFDIDIETGLDAEYIILKTSKGIIGVGKNHKSKVLCQFRKNRRIRKL
ncbi:MAG: hypothetical protein JW791_00225 [Nanoarchaeota archaeon]|nr:hypothetical protein [Nanoarchaeota archaeon]